MTHSHSTHTPHVAPGQMAEPDEIHVGTIVRFGIGLTVVTVVSHIAMLLMFNSLKASADAANTHRVYPLAATLGRQVPPEPRLQGGVESINGQLVNDPPEHNPGPRKALAELHRDEAVILNGYAWVDRNAQMARIPVAEAMKLTVQRGLPARGAAAAPSAAEPGKEQGK